LSKSLDFGTVSGSLFSARISTVYASSETDTFTGTAGTLLENHTSDSGNTWAKQTGQTGGVVITNSNRARLDTGSLGIYLSNWTPSSADYDVSTDVYVASNAQTAGIGGRAGSASFTGYYAILAASSGKILLYRGGNGTALGSYTPTIVVGTTYQLKLEMRGNSIKVYWNGSSIINVTVTGTDIISATGAAAMYFQYGETDTVGFHLDNFLAQNPSILLSAGILSETSHTSSSTTVSWTNASGGTAPIATQLQRSPSGTGTWSNVSGATTSPVTDTGLSSSTAYDYRVVYTDSVPTTVYSNTITITTSVASTTYTIQQADLWDNGYDNVSAPRQSTFSRFVFTTDAASVTVGGTTSIYTSYPQFADLGVRVNGVNQSSLVFTANGSQSFTVSLGTAGTTRTVEIISGLQSKPSSTVIGSFIDSITYPNSATFTVQAPTIQPNRILVYGDSISTGADATNPEIEGYIPLLRNTYGYSVMSEGWGYRTLYDDTNTSGLRSAFVSRIAGYTPSIIWIAIGTNDYALNMWNATNFGVAYTATLDDLHTALPSARIFCQTPIVRVSESANSFGNTTGDYRNQITTICNARSWTTLVDGTALLTTSDLDGSGVHPTTAGQAKYAKRMAPVLTSPSYTVSGPSTGKNSQTSSAFTATIASASFMGDQTITITASNGTVTATAVGGSISNNGTGTVVVTPANTATSFTFTYTPTTEGVKTLTFTNGQSWSNPSAVTYTSDSTAPSGGSITYTNGYQTTTTVSLTVNDGTDTNSGIDTSSRIIQRESATLTNGTCGSYGGWGTIATTEHIQILLMLQLSRLLRAIAININI
jgi:lysophospholipase L1-like esterase